jgi:hypothetical protein
MYHHGRVVTWFEREATVQPLPDPYATVMTSRVTLLFATVLVAPELSAACKSLMAGRW